MDAEVPCAATCVRKRVAARSAGGQTLRTPSNNNVKLNYF